MTLKSDMLRALEESEDSNLKDVTLVGSDGDRVSATKAVLAIRSGVFQRMFFGNFQESTPGVEVKMDYSGVVLRVVVKYCYTDELDLDLLIPDDDETDHMTDAEAVAMVQVRDAANYLELSDLHKTLSNELGESILTDENKGDLACVCAILQELMARGGADGSLWSTCMDLVEANPDACFLPTASSAHNQGILACSLALLGQLFQSTKLDAYVAVKALRNWNEQHVHTLQEGEKTELQKLADEVLLESISAAHLAEIQPCALFPMERLYKAFVHHGKAQSPTSAAAATFPPVPPPPPPPPMTATIRGAGVECVNGVYEWKGNYGYYELVGKYGDMPSLFRLRRQDDGWQLVVVPDVLRGNPNNPTNDNTLILYEASESSSNNRPPFALWDSADGQEPTPYVSVQKSGVPPTTSTTTDYGFASLRAASNALPAANADQLADAFRAQMAVNNNNNGNQQVRRRIVGRRRPFANS